MRCGSYIDNHVRNAVANARLKRTSILDIGMGRNNGIYRKVQSSL